MLPDDTVIHLVSTDLEVEVKYTIFALLLLLSGVSASAADLAPKPVEPVPPTPVFSWTGFYVGGNIGAAWISQSYSTSPQATLVTAPYQGSLQWGRHLSGSQDVGILGGVQAGYNWDFGNTIVIGAEADFQFSSARAKNDSSATTVAVIQNNIKSETPWFGTVRARLGTTYFSPNLLIYATGGLAYGQEKISAEQRAYAGNTLLSVFPLSTKQTRVGFAVGGGAEWALNEHWSVGAEYLFVDLKANGSKTGRTTVLGPQALATDAIRIKVNDLKENVVRLKVNYRF